MASHFPRTHVRVRVNSILSSEPLPLSQSSRLHSGAGMARRSITSVRNALALANSALYDNSTLYAVGPHRVGEHLPALFSVCTTPPPEVVRRPAGGRSSSPAISSRILRKALDEGRADHPRRRYAVDAATASFRSAGRSGHIAPCNQDCGEPIPPHTLGCSGIVLIPFRPLPRKSPPTRRADSRYSAPESSAWPRFVIRLRTAMKL